MNMVESKWLQDHHGWGSVEYGEFVCVKCKKKTMMVHFAHCEDLNFSNPICAGCWWRYTPNELGVVEDETAENRIAGVKPSTIVKMGKITIEQLEADIQKTRTENAELVSKFHEVWYNASFTWPYTHFLGVGMMKCPNDLWIYQTILSKLRPNTIIETGTYQGASALWFAYLMDMLGIHDGKVFTIDYEAYDLDPIVRHPRITYLHGNSVDPTLVAAIQEEMPEGPVLVCLDSDHSSKHVREELELYAPLCKVGDWLVVEDTNIGWTDGIEHKVRFGGDLGKCSCGMAFLVMNELREKIHPDLIAEGLKKVRCPNDKNDLGARGGLIEYMERHPGEWRQDILAERYLLTMNPGGWLQRTAECDHRKHQVHVNLGNGRQWCDDCGPFLSNATSMDQIVCPNDKRDSRG